ncbi:unnamed protein product [Pedinophyceae sp. YPF-701]|nr:unnamed protein product [Pedinophyceae sp. YPF-701]
MTSRRQTLGALSPAQLNSRPSLAAPGRVDNAEKKDRAKRVSQMPPGRRGSVAPAGAPARRASSMAPKRGAGDRQDPRPVSDKAYRDGCIRALVTYLSTHGYDHAIAPKQLANPTSKEFTHIVNFLCRRIDPNMDLSGKIEDEVPLFFKRLHYPFQITKPSLYAVGAPNTWPHVLAAMVWLVEILAYEEKAEAARARAERDGVAAEGADDKVFFEYIAKSYTSFLSGDDDTVEALDREMEARFCQRQGDMETDLNSLKDENATLKERLRALKEAPSELAEIEARRAELRSDVGKFGEHVGKLRAAIGKEAGRIEERRADVAARERDLAELRARNAQLQASVDAQAVTTTDMARMAREREKLDAMMTQVSTARENLEAELGAKTMETSEALDALEQVAAQYNQLAVRLQMAPATAKRAKGQDLSMAVCRDAASPSDIVRLGIKSVVRPAVARFRDHYAAVARERTEQELVLREKVDGLDEHVNELRGQVAREEAAVGAAEAVLAKTRAELDFEMQHAGAQAERVRLELEELRGKNSSELAASNETAADAGRELAETQARCEREMAEMHVAVVQALEQVLAFKRHVQGTVRDVRERIGAARRQVVENAVG